MIEIITNNLGSGDWVVVNNAGDRIHSGHDISLYDLQGIFSSVGLNCKITEVDDETMERLG